MSDEDVEKVWNEFWGPVIDQALEDAGFELPRPGSWMTSERPDGTVVMDVRAFNQIKRELADWHFAMGEVSKVYSHVTGGMLSKPNYHAAGVCNAADEHAGEQANERFIDALLDTTSEMDGYDAGVEVFVTQLLDNMGIAMDEVTDAGKERERIQAMLAKLPSPSTPVDKPVEDVELPAAENDVALQLCNSTYALPGWRGFRSCAMTREPEHERHEDSQGFTWTLPELLAARKQHGG